MSESVIVAEEGAVTLSGFTAAAPVSAVPPGWVLTVKVGHREFALANRDGEIHALDTFCTHAGGPIGDSRLKGDCFVECPWHKAVFDVRDGEPHSGPARKPLRTYQVKIENGTIYIAMDDGG